MMRFIFTVITLYFLTSYFLSFDDYKALRATPKTSPKLTEFIEVSETQAKNKQSSDDNIEYLSMKHIDEYNNIERCDLLAADPLDSMKPNNVIGADLNIGTETVIDVYVPLMINDEAIRACQLALNEGYTDRLNYQLGRAYLSDKQFDLAFEYIERSAMNNYVAAQTTLGYLYGNGYGTAQSYEKAVKWYRKAADNGHAKAMSSLSIYYLFGWGVETSMHRSRYWREQANAYGHE